MDLGIYFKRAHKFPFIPWVVGNWQGPWLFLGIYPGTKRLRNFRVGHIPFPGPANQ